jgi:hypothetical protein
MRPPTQPPKYRLRVSSPSPRDVDGSSTHVSERAETQRPLTLWDALIPQGDTLYDRNTHMTEEPLCLLAARKLSISAAAAFSIVSSILR